MATTTAHGQKQTAVDVLLEYAKAIRGDWAFLDGRTVKADLDYLAQKMTAPALDEESLRGLRLSSGICPRGLGCWVGEREDCVGCKDDGCLPPLD